MIPDPLGNALRHYAKTGELDFVVPSLWARTFKVSAEHIQSRIEETRQHYALAVPPSPVIDVVGDGK